MHPWIQNAVLYYISAKRYVFIRLQREYSRKHCASPGDALITWWCSLCWCECEQRVSPLFVREEVRLWKHGNDRFSVNSQTLRPEDQTHNGLTTSGWHEPRAKSPTKSVECRQITRSKPQRFKLAKGEWEEEEEEGEEEEELSKTAATLPSCLKTVYSLINIFF